MKIEDLAMQYRDTLYMLNRKLVKMVESAESKQELVHRPQYLVLISEISEVNEKWCQLKKYCNARGLELRKAGVRKKPLKRGVE